MKLLCFIMLFIAITSHKAQSFEDDFAYNDGLPMILEPIIQKYHELDYAWVYNKNQKYYISMTQVASYLGFKYEKKGDTIHLYWGLSPQDVYINLKTKVATIDNKTSTISNDDFKYFEDSLFASTTFLSQTFNLDIKIDELEMTLDINSPQIFPSTRKKDLSNSHSKYSVYAFEDRSTANYDFDSRLFAPPTLDLSLGKGWSRYNEKSSNSDSYAANISALAGGMDLSAYVYGYSQDNRDYKMRLRGSREFTTEQKNPLNIRKINIGDINSLSDSYFSNSYSGRGVSASSFKNLITSADKTIDITGPLKIGWQVELCWNNQLLGYRQSGTNGEYLFKDIPVSYGLNTFKLVFYGPYGEVETEEKRYYSGTSPVKKGEFGYNISAYQPDRYIVEKNELFQYDKKTDDAIFDFMGYYGFSDNLTFMSGFTSTPDQDKTDIQNFGIEGLQYAVDGLSLQYNLEQNLDTTKFAHHVEAQGDVHVGNIYASYDDYQGIHSPKSQYGNDYLEKRYETRFSGVSGRWNLPYYVNYQYGTYEESKQSYHDVSARVSKQLQNGVSLSLEDNFYKYSGYSTINNDIRVGAYKWWDVVSSEAWITHETSPKSRFKEIKLRADWRTGRRTYLSGEYTHDLINNMDTITLSAGKVYNFGGITATLSFDRDENVSFYLNYNISFAKVPNRNKIIKNTNSKFSDTGSMYVNVKDEYNTPLEGIGIKANSLEKEIFTDEQGEALLTDLQTYEKIQIKLDEETFPDVSLQTLEPMKKVILRPGTIRPLNIELKHFGAVEGKLENINNRLLFGYMIVGKDKDDNEISSTFADTEGYFILDGLPFNTYKLEIIKDGTLINSINNIEINDVITYIEQEITLFEKLQPKIEEDNENNEDDSNMPFETVIFEEDDDYEDTGEYVEVDSDNSETEQNDTEPINEEKIDKKELDTESQSPAPPPIIQ